ncbi:MAG: hypothetical protein MUP03_09895, partial [Anaerolineales bacterium]|nr:hypothetical protein [Anaerolineales bacterium]
GIRPEQVVDFKALVGDKSDNIPGVPGVGEKTAQALLTTYKTLDNIYSHLEDIEPRWRSKLAEGKESAYMSRDLATIRTNLPVKLDLEQARADRFDPAAVEALFRELEFRTLLDRLMRLSNTSSADTSAGTQQLSFFGQGPVVIQTPVPAADIEVHIAETTNLLDDLSTRLNSARMISFDTETTSTNEMQAEIVGISLAVREGEGFYVPVGHSAGKNLPLDKVLSALRGPLTDPRIPKIGHNLKYDYIILARCGLRVEPLSFDTMIAEWLIDPASRNLGLKNLALARLGEEMTHIEDLIGKGKNQGSMADVPIETAASYAAADAEICLRLYPLMKEELERVEGLSLLNQMEMPLVPVLAEMEMTGVLLDLAFFQRMSV